MIRINLIKHAIELNEKLVFNRKLIKSYKDVFTNGPNLVLDVGSNTGQSIDLFLKLNSACVVHGFEPNPKLFDKLKSKYRNKKNIYIHPIGISDTKGKKIFYENVLHSTSSFEELDLDSTYLKKKAKVLGVKNTDIISNSYPVEVTTLYDFIERNIDAPIDILKIDTEGHEYACLAGLFTGQTKVPIRFIQIENHEDDMYLNKRSFAEIQELIQSNGYTIHARIKHGFGDFYEVLFKLS